MKVFRQIGIFLSLNLLCNISYSQAPYQLSRPNIPFPDNKHEGIVDAYAGIQGIGINLSYAIDNHFVIFANGYGHYEIWSDWLNNPNIVTNISDFQGDIGGGYYTKFEKRGLFEALGGTGFGNVYFDDASYNYTEIINGQYFHLFAQADIGYSSKNLELGFGLRLSNLYGFTNVKEILDDQNGHPQSTSIASLSGDALFVEPCGIFAFGAKNVKIKMSLGFSDRLIGSDIPSTYVTLYQTVNFCIGLTVSINRK